MTEKTEEKKRAVVTSRYANNNDIATAVINNSPGN